jgi:hypothetical protein
MLSEEEKAFIQYWEENRDKKKSLLRQLLPGISIGLTVGVGIILMLDSGWYIRANMEAQSESSPYVIFISIVGIAAFIGFFYKKFRWEMNDQTYRELKAREEKEQKNNSTV